MIFKAPRQVKAPSDMPLSHKENGTVTWDNTATNNTENPTWTSRSLLTMHLEHIYVNSIVSRLQKA